MDRLNKLPLYMGLFIFVGAVLLSAVKVGSEKSALLVNRSNAAQSGAKLSLTFTKPNTVSVTLNSDSTVGGIDVVVKYDKSKLSILPSTLRAGSDSFITTGGIIDSNNGTFKFSALTKSGIKDGIVANFNVVPNANQKEADTQLQLVPSGSGGSNVIDKATTQNILNSVNGVEMIVTVK
ncbi:cohesin domain-containing protein [Patescibacteria group bacterium]|nr:cohesin domain-containing protein [Patescibacteria group bacterium]MCL5798393.1 cohesin domain-containing protein [Patescibacteria group bacterium]